MRTCSQSKSRKKGQRTSRKIGAAMSAAREVRGANFFAARPTAKWPMNMRSEAPEQLVEFVGGIEIRFEFAGGEALTEIVQAAREKIERGGKHVLVGKDDVAPRGIRAAGKAQRIAQPGAGKRYGQAVFVEVVVEKAGERDSGKLWKMRREANGVIMLRRAKPERTRADFFENSHERGDTRILLRGRRANQSVGVPAEKVGVGVSDPGEFAPGHGMPTQEKRPFLTGKMLRSSLSDTDLGAASIGDQR